jgi:hypothetical protein
VINVQVGDCWLWSLIIFLIYRFVSAVLGPHSLTGGVGGISPSQMSPRGGDENFCSPPLVGDSWAVPPKRNFGNFFSHKIL